MAPTYDHRIVPSGKHGAVITLKSDTRFSKGSSIAEFVSHAFVNSPAIQYRNNKLARVNRGRIIVVN